MIELLARYDNDEDGWHVICARTDHGGRYVIPDPFTMASFINAANGNPPDTPVWLMSNELHALLNDIGLHEFLGFEYLWDGKYSTAHKTFNFAVPGQYIHLIAEWDCEPATWNEPEYCELNVTYFSEWYPNDSLHRLRCGIIEKAYRERQ